MDGRTHESPESLPLNSFKNLPMQATNPNMILTLKISEACNIVKENRACEEESNMDKFDSLP